MSAIIEALKEANGRVKAAIGTEQFERVGRAIGSLKHAHAALGDVSELDQRSVALARTKIEEALLWVCDAEAKAGQVS